MGFHHAWRLVIGALALSTIATLAVAKETGRQVEAMPEPGIAQELIAEHTAAVVERLDATRRGRDAAIALMLTPMARPDGVNRMFHGMADRRTAFDLALDVRWATLLEDLDDAPPTLLHALAYHARKRMSDADWQRYEETLLHRDSANLASWMYRLESLQHDPPALDAWLRRAAQRVDHYHTLSYQQLALMLGALARTPMDEGLAQLFRDALILNLDGDTEHPLDDRALWATDVLGIQMAIAMPAVGEWAKTCSVDATAERRARRDACLTVIRRALPGAGDGLAQLLLVNPWVRITEGTPEHDEALEAKRVARWQTYHADVLTRVEQIAPWIDEVFTPRSSELGWLHKSMLRRGIPLTPPGDWEPDDSMPIRGH